LQKFEYRFCSVMPYSLDDIYRHITEFYDLHHRDFRLPSQSRWELHSSGLLRGE